MKKHPLLTIVLTLVIVFAVSSAGMVVYTATLDDTAAMVVAKQLYVGAHSTDSTNINRILSPGKSGDCAVVLSNEQRGKTVGVDLDVSISLNTGRSLFEAMPGLEICLLNEQGELMMTWNEDNYAETYDAGVLFRANVPGTYTYTLRTTWQPGNNSTVNADSVNNSTYGIRVNGMEHIEGDFDEL